MRKMFLLLLLAAGLTLGQEKVSPEKEASLRADVAAQIDGMKKQAQVMVDTVFSFGELGFQEFETSRYLQSILEKEGFRIEPGLAGIPTAFIATWGQGKPVIALGSDIDDIPQASQKPGVAYHDPIIEGAPGHGEGHNSGMPLNILAALAVKRVMEREHLSGTIKLWPGVAEELLATKAYYVRAGVFSGVDVVLDEDGWLLYTALHHEMACHTSVLLGCLAKQVHGDEQEPGRRRSHFTYPNIVNTDR